MSFDDFVKNFKQDHVALVTDDSPAFEAVCAELERCGWSLSSGCVSISGQQPIATFAKANRDWPWVTCQHASSLHITLSKAAVKFMTPVTAAEIDLDDNIYKEFNDLIFRD